MDRDNIYKVVESRIKDFSGLLDVEDWFKKWFCPLLEKITVDKIEWEETIGFLKSNDAEASFLEGFYSKCVEFNERQ